MPNWCYTTIKFVGDKTDITALYDLIKDCEENQKQFENTPFKKVDFGSAWLGYPLVKTGFADYIDNDDRNKNIRCRGWIENYEEPEKITDDEYSLDITTSTAWCPMLKMWQKIIDALKLTSVKFCAESEEPYQTYDPYNLGFFAYDQIHIDGYLTDETADAFPMIANLIILGYCTKETFLDMVNKDAKTSFTDIDRAVEFIENFNEKFPNEDDYIFIHQFTQNDDIETYE